MSEHDHDEMFDEHFEGEHDELDPAYTPHPDDPFPLPRPGRPIPIPIPRPPWQCLRRGPVSGRYVGTTGRTQLELRVDIDPRGTSSPVMNRLSGDFFEVYSIARPGAPPITTRVYRESWIMDAPRVTWSRCAVTITGTVRYWQGTHPTTTARIHIPWATLRPAGPADAAFTSGSTTTRFSCRRESTNFRDVTFEIDVCNSVNAPPIVPAYDTHAHPNRPASTPRRTLSIERAYQEAGIGVTMNAAAQTVIDDSAPGFQTWSPGELHDAMETAFSEHPRSWPRWSIWGLLAGTFDSSSVAGIMFDAAAGYGGAGDAPERQGFAVFRNHSWFANLPAGAPANDAEAAALRDYVYTWVHEAGHAFNFLHSWNKSRPDSLSWMNYPWRYDGRNGDGSFWRDFEFRFDDEELVHIRHGDRVSVIAGGDPWASGGHAEAPAGANATFDGLAPLELEVRSAGAFELMDDVRVELRLRNLLEHSPIEIDGNLAPEHGSVRVYIRRPDGRIVEFHPLYCLTGTPDARVLDASTGRDAGNDRYSAEVSLTYGAHGFAFDTPGEYVVRAVYQGLGGIVVPSSAHRIRVLAPSPELERHAADFYRREVGLLYALGGSASDRLRPARDVLQTLVAELPARDAGVRAAQLLAGIAARPFYRLEPAGRKMVRAQEAKPELALELTRAAEERYRASASRAVNLRHHHLVRQRAEWLVAAGRMDEAQTELTRLRAALAGRGVYDRVLTEVDAAAKALRAGERVKGRSPIQVSARDLSRGTDLPSPRRRIAPRNGRPVPRP